MRPCGSACLDRQFEAEFFAAGGLQGQFDRVAGVYFPFWVHQHQVQPARLENGAGACGLCQSRHSTILLMPFSTMVKCKLTSAKLSLLNELISMVSVPWLVTTP